LVPAGSIKLVREIMNLRTLRFGEEPRTLSDIVKRRSIQVLRVTEKSRAARYLHLGIGSR